MFQFPRLASHNLWIQLWITDRVSWVFPFGHPGINGFVRLPQEFRCFSRPSSPASAKASPVCAYSFPLTRHVATLSLL